MDLQSHETREIIRRLQAARLRLLESQPFYALLLLHMRFALDLSCETAYTDGTRIAFHPDFIRKLSDRDIEFVLLHEILHVVLQHCYRTPSDVDQERFNIACDIVVNSNILHSWDMDLSRITLSQFGVAMHRTPNGQEGHLFSIEELYQMLPVTLKLPSDERGKGGGAGRGDENDEGEGDNSGQSGSGQFDDHSRWGQDEDAIEQQTWLQRMCDATDILSRQNSSQSWGTLPAGLERILKQFRQPQTDWRTVLNDFVQTEIVDYSFSPPDRRFADSPFFLPDFNEPCETVEDVLFMVDTSGSMSDAMITDAYGEIKGAIDQFDGRLKGWLGFFDAEVIPPKPFSSKDEFSVIRPSGGGGTSFDIIFDYVWDRMQDKPPVSIVILTDGYAPFPEQERSNGIPVLWMINNDNVTPPWGKVARISADAPKTEHPGWYNPDRND